MHGAGGKLPTVLQGAACALFVIVFGYIRPTSLEATSLEATLLGPTSLEAALLGPTSLEATLLEATASPVHCKGVTWVSGLGDSICFFLEGRIG